jgi:hypothetical protein
VFTFINLLKYIAAVSKPIENQINAVRNSISNTYYFLLIFFLVFFAYSLSLYFYFGNFTYEFSTMNLAFNSCMLMLMSEVIGFARMQRYDPTYTIAYISSFIYFLNIIMMNTFIAIVIYSFKI